MKMQTRTTISENRSGILESGQSTSGAVRSRGRRQWSAIARLALIALLFSPGISLAAEKVIYDVPIPDFTKGDAVPDRWGGQDWNLGATGMRGWIYGHKFSTSSARQILVTQVDKGSPADGVIMVGDVILGVGGQPFSSDARFAFGKALTQAETDAGGGRLALLRWRKGKTEPVVVKIQVMGSYGPTAPYGSPKVRKIIDQGCEVITKRIQSPNYKTKSSSGEVLEGSINPITRCLNAMALLGSGNPKYLPLIKKEAVWASEFSTHSFETWWYGYTIIFVAEYINATGDRSVLPGLRRMALESANGQSVVGSWGHGFAGPDGRCTGYGMMNGAGLPLTIGLVEARKVGVDDPIVTKAIDRSVTLFNFYIGKGSIPYGDHDPWMETHGNIGKNSEVAILFDLVANAEGASFFSRMATASYGEERELAHTGNFFSLLWALPGIALSGPQATGAWMTEYGDWYFDLARRWDGSFSYLGKPTEGNGGDKYHGWDSTGAYLLSCELPLKKLWITGEQRSVAPQLSDVQAQQVIEDGRGYTTEHRCKEYYGKFTTKQLLAKLGNWSPIVRDRTATELAARSDTSVKPLIDMLGSPDTNARLGACAALTALKDKAAPAAPALVQQLDAKDMWLRVSAAQALAAMGQPGMVALPKMLTLMSEGPTKQDARNMQQRFLSFAVFGTMLKRNSLKGVDQDLLRQAIAATLRNDDGKARTVTSGMYQKLTLEEIRPILPAIYDAIVKPAPSGVMFADGVRTAGLQLLAKHKIMKGLPLCLDIMDIERWGKLGRISGCITALEEYGAAAKPMLPRLRQLEKDLKAHREAKMLQPCIVRLENIIHTLENT